MNKTVFCDLDETLVINTAFVDARREFAELMSSEGFSFTEADNLMEQIDSEAVREHGFGDRLRFSNSMTETYQALCDKYKKKTRVPVQHKARQIGLDALQKPVQLMTGALGALEYLKIQDYRLYVVTKGNQEVQEKKIFSTGLDKLLDGWFVFDHKTILEMYEALRASRSIARHSYYVGNSPRSDANPSYLAGLNSIYIPHPNTWIAELEPLLDGVITIDNISKLKDIIK